MHGFLVRNAAGQEILRGKEETYLLYKKGVINQTLYGYNSEQGKEHIHDILGGISIYDNPLLFVSINFETGFDIYIGITPKSYSKTTGQILDSRAVINISGFSGNTTYYARIEYYVFVPAHLVPLPKFGMALYNENGQLAFHNGAKPLNVSGFLNLPRVYWHSTPELLPSSRDDSVYAYRAHKGLMLSYLSGSKMYKTLNKEKLPYITKSHY